MQKLEGMPQFIRLTESTYPNFGTENNDPKREIFIGPLHVVSIHPKAVGPGSPPVTEVKLCNGHWFWVCETLEEIGKKFTQAGFL